jgi:hypothetical protein
LARGIVAGAALALDLEWLAKSPPLNIRGVAILRAFPTLTREQLRAAVAYAASSALRSLPLSDRAALEVSNTSDGIDDGERERVETTALDKLTQEAQRCWISDHSQ